MMTRPRNVRVCVLAICIALPFGLLGPAEPVSAREPARPGDARPILGCGKAQALAARYLAEQIYGDDPSLREAMADTDVLHYALDIEISNLNPAGNTCTISGANGMTIQSKSASLTEFTFRLRSQYSVTSAFIGGSTPVTVNNVSTTTWTATLDRTYGVDEVFELTVNYTGNSVSRGFGSIEVETQFGTPVVATLSEPYFSYTWWPVKDGDYGDPGDNSDKATLEFSITAPNNYVVPSNGELLSVETLSDNRKRYNWASDYPIAPYLVSFAATDYNTWTQTYTYPDGTMPVEFYIYPGNDTGGNRTAWEKVMDMLPVFANVYGEYPFVDEKYGIYNFNFGGGMEHQTITGLGTFSESVNAHELAHQWWGDMTTCKTWHDIWLNEGFATYGECLWEEFKTGASNPAAYFNAVQAHKPFSVGDSVYVYDPSDLNRIFSYTYSYLKGCWVLHQLRGVVGDQTFFDILADYRSAYAYSAATTDDFTAVASATYGQDLSWFIDQWVYQIGAPAYRYGWVSVNVNGQDYLLVRLRQTQSAGYPAVFIMPVDLELTIGGSPQTVTVWNDADPEWFVVPVGGPVTALQFDPDEWILRTSAASESYVAGPPKIVVTSPAPGGIVEVFGATAAIDVTFHTDVTTSAGDYALVGAGGVPSGVGFSYNGATYTVTLSNVPPDEYTLTVSDAVTAVNSGDDLDGEIADPLYPASLPSGDGVPGGNAVIEFAVICQFGDSDCDGDVDLRDYAAFQTCFTGPDAGPPPTGCATMRFDADLDVDLDDLAQFNNALLGP